jgi:hypothetical protein
MKLYSPRFATLVDYHNKSYKTTQTNKRSNELYSRIHFSYVLNLKFFISRFAT